MSTVDAEHSLDTPPQQLLAYAFPPGFSFEGQLVGALQRIESGGALRILEALFVGREESSGELVAVSLAGRGAGGMIGKLIGFRLEESARKRQTEETLAGPAGATVRELAASLEPGAAVAGLLVEHAWAGVLGDAVRRLGGAEVANEIVGASAAEAPWARLAGMLAASAPPRA